MTFLQGFSDRVENSPAMTKFSFLLPLLALALVGCQSSSPAPSSSEPGAGAAEAKKLRIAVIPKGTTHEFWKSVEAGAKAAGDELGVEVIWKGPLKEDNLDEQIKVVEDFTTQKVDGIVVAPLNDVGMRASVMEAQNAGIPVVIFDSGLKDVDVTSFVATDNRKAGASGGETLAKLLTAGKKVLVLRYQEGSASTTEREEGALEALRAAGAEILSDNQFAGATVETAQKAAENLINRFKKPDGTLGVDGIFTPNESSTFGMLRALEDAGFAGKVKFVGFDASAKLVEGLGAGKIDALVVQNPVKMGNEAVKAMVAHLKKETVEKRIDTGAAVATKANMNEAEIATLLGLK